MTDASPPLVLSLPGLADELLAAAHEASSGRATRALPGTPKRDGGGATGPDDGAARDRARSAGRAAERAHRGVLTQVVLALTEGSRLSDHENPGEATLQVLHGSVRLSTAAAAQELNAGELFVIPQERHDLRALADAVVILTIARHAGGAERAERTDAAEHADGGEAA